MSTVSAPKNHLSAPLRSQVQTLAPEWPLHFLQPPRLTLTLCQDLFWQAMMPDPEDSPMRDVLLNRLADEVWQPAHNAAELNSADLPGVMRCLQVVR